MRTVDCPQCGAPVEIAVEHAHAPQRCARCSHEFALPEPLRALVAESRAVIERSEERDRQLDAKERASLTAAGSAGLLSALWLGVTLVPPGVIAAFWLVVWSREGSSEALLFAFGLLPLALSVLVAIITRRSIAAQRARLIDACAADVSSGPSQRALCHLCGGALDAGEHGVARCRYCRADNVVDPEIVRRAHANRDKSREQNARAVLATLAELRRAARRSALISAVSIFSGPVVSAVALVAVVFALDAREVPLHAAEYTAVSTAHGTCIAKVTRFSARVRLSFGGASQFTPEDRPNADGLAITQIQAWVGRSVRSAQSGSPPRTIRRAFGTGTGANYVELDDGEKRLLEGLCQAE